MKVWTGQAAESLLVYTEDDSLELDVEHIRA